MSKKKTSKAKASAWFIPVRGSYLPASGKGWLTYIPFIAFCVEAAAWTVQQPSSVGYQVFTIASEWILAAAVLTFVAARHS